MSEGTKSAFDRVWDFLQAIMVPFCGALITVWFVQLFYPQPASFYGWMALIAFGFSVVFTAPKEYARLYGGK